VRTRTKNFLIVKIGALGDVCFALPAVGALREAFPGARVDWLVGSRDADLLQGLPGLAKLWIVDSGAVFGRSLRALLSESLEFRRAMPRYDAVLLLHRNWNFVAWLSALAQRVPGPPIFRLSRNTARWPRVISVHVPSRSMHESLAIREVVRRVVRDQGGLDEFEWRWDFSHLPTPARFGSDVTKPYWVIHPGGGSNAKTVFLLKQWPHWESWTNGIVEQIRAQWILVGAASELEDWMAHPRLNNWIGRTTVPELVGLIREAEGFVGVDSGPLHLADALGIPAIGLYGPTSDTSWGLLGPRSRVLTTRPSCAPCYRDDGIVPICRHDHRCMKDLIPDQVTRVIRTITDARNL